MNIAAKMTIVPCSGTEGQLKRACQREVVTDERRERHTQNKREIQEDIQHEHNQRGLQTSNRKRRARPT